MIDQQKITRICEQIDALSKVQATEWGEQISKIIIAEHADSSTIAHVIVQLKPPKDNHPGALKTWRELLVPLLQAQIGLDNADVMRRLSRSTNWLAFAAIFFGAIQAMPVLRTILCWVIAQF